MAEALPCFRRKCFDLIPSGKPWKRRECRSALDSQLCQLPESEALLPVVVPVRASFIDEPDWLR